MLLFVSALGVRCNMKPDNNIIITAIMYGVELTPNKGIIYVGVCRKGIYAFTSHLKMKFTDNIIIVCEL